MGEVTANGYGRLKVDRGRSGKSRMLAHRLSYSVFVGPLVDGLVVHHVCEQRECVNPDHLRLTTQRENALCGKTTKAFKNTQKTACPRGHPYDEANCYVWDGKRHCRKCLAAKMRRYNARRREAMRGD